MTSTTHDERLIVTPGEPGGRGGPEGLDGDGLEGPQRRRPRLFTVLTVVIGGLALAAGAWYVSQALVKPGGQSVGELPLLVADTAPVKIRPEDPGGAEVANRDKYVYKSLEGEPSEQPVEQLLPAPEEPMAKPVDSGPLIEPLPGVSLEAMWAKPAPEPAPTPKAAPAIEQPSSVEKETLAPPEQAAPESATTGTESLLSETAPALVKDTAGVATAETAVGTIWIQLAAMRDQPTATAEWARLMKGFPTVLGTLERRTERADLGAKGVWFRVQAGPFDDPAKAAAACKALAAQGGSCKVVEPG